MPTSAISRPPRRRRAESGQALVIIAASFIGMAAFIGLAIDLGILIVAQAHLRRAVDSAAIAAASQLRESQSFDSIGRFAAQYIRFNNVDVTTVVVQRCQATTGYYQEFRVTGITADAITGTVTAGAVSAVDPDQAPLRDMCGTPGATRVPRKQIRVEAESRVVFSFLPIIGLTQTNIQVDAVSEAASIDVVLVFGTGETMGQFTYPTRGDGLNNNYGPDFDPRDPTLAPGADPGCNANAGPNFAKRPENDPGYDNDVSIASLAKCRPLWDAKQAGKRLVDTLYDGFDQVAIVGYDFAASVYATLTPNLGQRATASTNSTGIYAAIDSLILRNDVAPPSREGLYNPLNINCQLGDPLGLNSTACTTPDPNQATLSNCAGCGIRVAANILKQSGRPESLWVIVFLSDGFASVSDLPDAILGTAGDPLRQTGISQALFPNGYCPGQVSANPQRPDRGLWSRPRCVNGSESNGDAIIADASPLLDAEAKQNVSLRHCIQAYHNGQVACPPGALFLGTTGVTTTAILSGGVPVTQVVYYDVHDYALDMVDQAALTTNCPPGTLDCAGGTWPPNGNRYNSSERLFGNNIVIYAIGLGQTVIWDGNNYAGEQLLRYMAAVGDDGDRATDACDGVAVGASCGNYYFAPDPSALGPVFEDIARRIFTRITR